ncbi:hypothetical protein QYE76_044655 [Lolium multiflorum]|uniref:Uncharacterized protein n=1 Tax=Lolium multiflorum TaxID=4521 RepID=A0AAD8WWR3_LOLMU|nr:hypothetical protein QYE76_044655 [Lolium multiflorum]
MAAAAEGKGEASGTTGKAGTEPTLDDLLKIWKLKGEDIGGVFVPKSEVEALKEGAKWMAVMPLLTMKPFSATSLKKMMRFAWAPTQEVVEVNIFLVQANCLGDWERITDQGLAERMGEVLTVDMNGAGFEGGNYVRVRIWLDIRKKLTTFISFDPEGEAKVIMRVRYEKIPRYRGVLGLLGHEQDECGMGEHSPDAIKYGR